MLEAPLVRGAHLRLVHKLLPEGSCRAHVAVLVLARARARAR